MRVDNRKFNASEQIKLICEEPLFPTMLKRIVFPDTTTNARAVVDAYSNNSFLPIFQSLDATHGVLAKIETVGTNRIVEVIEESMPRRKDQDLQYLVVSVIRTIRKNHEDQYMHTVITPQVGDRQMKVQEIEDFSYDLSKMQEFMELTSCNKRLVSGNNSYNVAKYVYEQAAQLCKEGKADYQELLKLSCSSLFLKVLDIIKQTGRPGDTQINFLSETQAYEYILSHKYPEEVKKVVEMEKDNRDSRGKSLSFMNALANFPWYTKKQEETDISKFRQTLENSHYGLDKVKERVVENMVVRQHTKKRRSQILCLVGSPGVGKTSFAKAIAKAMNLPFQKISMSGANDASVLKGSNRCWLGSTMGQLAFALYKSGCINPVILIDEIEKANTEREGNATQVLLEALDKSQNSSFKDDFLTVGIDLSNVTFICTANYPEKIPAPLLDRMEIIFLPDYSEQERKTIFAKYVLPTARRQYELSKSQLVVKNDMINYIVENYSIDGGIRNLQRCADRLCCKAWMAIDSGESGLVVSKDNIKDLLGEGLSSLKKTKDTKAQVGVVNAMVVNGINKGDINKIECAYANGSGKLTITGNLSEMAKESCQVAFEHVKWQAENYGIDKDFFLDHDVLVHFTNSAIPKDGNSAGIALVTAIISALTDSKTIDNISLTGEISLRGSVSRVGGLKQKIEGAKENGIKTIIFPKENEQDLLEIPEEIKKGVNLIAVETYKEAYGRIFA